LKEEGNEKGVFDAIYSLMDKFYREWDPERPPIELDEE
jgi:hypothetical protein